MNRKNHPKPDKRVIHTGTVQLGTTWVPCEYMESARQGVRMVSIGEVELALGPGTKGFVKKPLAVVVAQFIASMPCSRKLVVLKPLDGLAPDQWPCRQILKRDLQISADLPDPSYGAIS